MKPNFLARCILERDNKKLYLCQKHADRELQIEGTKYIDTLPSDHRMPCLKCSEEYSDNWLL